MIRSFAAVTVALLLGTATAARADEPAPPAAPAPETTAPAAPAAATPLNYITVAATTTLFAVSNGGDTSGWGHDIGPVVGYGRYVTDTVAVELDLGPSFIRGDYAGFYLVPAAVWSFSTHVYAAARFLVQVDKEANFILFPGIGGVYTFDKISLTLEMNFSSNVGRGKPDFGVTLTPGVVYSF
jgi:hypothetical protein